MVSSAHYHEGSIFQKEQEKIFSATWLFAGMEWELKNNNDFVTLDIGKHALAIQNFRGTVKAFKNICLHRFGKIQTDIKGNRPFFCRYHGWAYTPDGAAIVPPKFTDDVPDKECMKLEAYPVEKCGAFYFVNTGNSELTLQQFLGAYYPVLEDLGKNFGKEIYTDVMPHKANWKLLVENVLECYHCRTVHAETFIPMGIGTLPAINFRYDNSHTDCEYPKKDSEELVQKQNKLSFLKHRTLTHHSYHHIYIYPNLFISSTEGILFYVGQLVPQSPSETELVMRFYAPVIDAPADVKVNEYMVKAYHDVSKDSALQVLLEDKAILENIQSVVGKIDRQPLFGKEEFRINDFYRSYFQDMNK